MTKAVGVLRRVAPGGPPGAREVPLRLSVRQDARLVRARRRRALADHAGAHQARPRVPARSTSTRPTRSGSTTRSSSSPSRPTTPARSSTSSSACARPSPRVHASATRRRSRASARRSSARSARSTASRSPPRSASQTCDHQRRGRPGEIRDITVIGAGPVGLSTAFWAGMREASSRIVDSLPQIGGQLTALYPEKWIFDVPGHPKVLAKDLVERCAARRSSSSTCPVHLETTIETIELGGRHRRPAHEQPGLPGCARARSSSPAATARSSPRSCPATTSTARGRAAACTTSSARSPSSPARRC